MPHERQDMENSRGMIAILNRYSIPRHHSRGKFILKDCSYTLRDAFSCDLREEVDLEMECS